MFLPSVVAMLCDDVVQSCDPRLFFCAISHHLTIWPPKVSIGLQWQENLNFQIVRTRVGHGFPWILETSQPGQPGEHADHLCLVSSFPLVPHMLPFLQETFVLCRATLASFWNTPCVVADKLGSEKPFPIFSQLGSIFSQVEDYPLVVFPKCHLNTRVNF